MAESIHYITTPTEIESVAKKLAQKKRIYIDLEFDKNHFSYGFNLCLMQIHDGEDCYLIDPLPENASVAPLFPIIEDKNIEKVCFAFSEDMRLLYHIGATPRHLVDLSVALFMLNVEPLSLTNSLVRFVEDFEDVKASQQKSNWLIRPLTDLQKGYAAEDVLYLPALYAALERELLSRHRKDWFLQEMEAFEQKDWDDDTAPYLTVKEMKSMTKTEWLRFVKLMDFREEQAKKMNKPTYKVIPKDLFKEMAHNPDLLHKWNTFKGLHPRLKNQECQQVIAQLFSEVERLVAQQKIQPYAPALDKLSPEEYQFIKLRKQRISAESKEYYAPIKDWLVVHYGEHLTHYILSNKRIKEYILGERIFLPYQKELVKEAMNSIGLKGFAVG